VVVEVVEQHHRRPKGLEAATRPVR
jgi:hypothetical protein